MTIENKIKTLSKETKASWKRIFTRVILGEFNRLNDGKEINDSQAIDIIKKLVKNSKEILVLKKNDAMALRELEFLNDYLPKQATEDQMKTAIDKATTHFEFKNIMQAMAPCIDILKKQGLDVDKKLLSEMLRSK